MSDNYTTTYRCDNCSDEKYYYLEKGTNIRDFLEDEVCTRCRCHIIQKKRKE